MIPHSRPTIEADDVAAVSRVLDSGHLAGGREVQAFEAEMAGFLGRAGGAATSSGTAAIHLALLALAVGPGDEVLIPSYTCVALLHAVHLTGARALLVDCAPGTVNISVDDAAAKRTPATKAVIVPHMFGMVAPVERFRGLGVPIIENCAQALGASVGGRPIGGVGDLTVVSFYATKMITTGEGGMVLADTSAVLDEVRDRRDYDKRSDHRLRFNYKMTDFQAALGRSQLRKLSRFVARRRHLATAYQRTLGQATSPVAAREGDACYRYVITVQDVDGFIGDMAAQGIEVKRPVHRPLHEFLPSAACPCAERLFQHTVSLPLYPSLSEAEVMTIANLAARRFRVQHGTVGFRI